MTGKMELEYPQSQEVIWADAEERVVCRSLNWLESDVHKITDISKNIVFVSEQASDEFPDSAEGVQLLENTLQPISEQVMAFYLNKENHRIVLPV